MLYSFSPPTVGDAAHVADKGHMKVGIIGMMRNFSVKFTRCTLAAEHLERRPLVVPHRWAVDFHNRFEHRIHGCGHRGCAPAPRVRVAIDVRHLALPGRKVPR
jgi:hypothetical protein